MNHTWSSGIPAAAFEVENIEHEFQHLKAGVVFTQATTRLFDSSTALRLAQAHRR